jgi:hypothetical protein
VGDEEVVVASFNVFSCYSLGETEEYSENIRISGNSAKI